MRKTLYTTAAFAVLVAATSGAKAEIYPLQGNNLFYVGGHVEGGIYRNQYWDKDNGLLLGNVEDNAFQLNQAVLAVGKKLDTTKSFDIGGRVDYMFGTDARITQSRGLEVSTGHGSHGWGSGDYYHSLAQAYVEGGNKNLSVKVGKFLSPFASEGIFSTDRFFYSLPVSYGLVPATLTGAVATYNVNDKLTVSGGWTNGYDNFFDTSDANAFLGGVSYKLNSTASVSYNTLVGDETEDGYSESYWYNTLKFDYKVSSKINYAAALELNRTTASYYRNTDLVLSQEVTYALNDKLAFGGRVEYANIYERARYVASDRSDVYSLAVAANWSPEKHIVVKPELRYDLVKSERLFDEYKKKDQISGGISLITKF